MTCWTLSYKVTHYLVEITFTHFCVEYFPTNLRIHFIEFCRNPLWRRSGSSSIFIHFDAFCTLDASSLYNSRLNSDFHQAFIRAQRKYQISWSSWSSLTLLTLVYWSRFLLHWTNKQSKLTNNNVFHKLSRQAPPLQVVYKP